MSELVEYSEFRKRLMQRQGSVRPCRSQNRHTFVCQAPFGHEGPHYSAAATAAGSDGVWSDQPPPRAA